MTQVNNHKLCTVAKANYILFLCFLLNLQYCTLNVSVYFRKRYFDTLHYLKNSKNSLSGHLKLDKTQISSKEIQKQIYLSGSLLMRGEIYQFPLEKD